MGGKDVGYFGGEFERIGYRVINCFRIYSDNFKRNF